MLFCPKCGSLLRPIEKNGKEYLVCDKCGYSSKEKEDILLHEKVEKPKKLEIIDGNMDVKVLPKVKEECPKCGNKMAYFWTLQTRAGDEAETKFFQCTKCKHRWREYE